MGAMATRPLLRWLLPAGLAAVIIGGGAATTAITAAADASLPSRSAAQLLVDVETARLDGLSGTVVERADLGLPDLPTIGGQGSSDLNSLITGSHTLRVWYSGPAKMRVALLGNLGESDIIRNGTDLWTWASNTNSATHTTLPSEATRTPSALPSQMPMTPQQVADQALAAITPTTQVSTNGTATVAGRPAYDLVLTPKDTASKVASVHIAIDGTEHVPVRVQVYARGHAQPAIEVGFTQVSFARPDAAQFRFTPPPGVRVTQRDLSGMARQGSGTVTGPKPVVVGTGWTAVLAARMPSGMSLPGLGARLLPGGGLTPGASQDGGANPAAGMSGGAEFNAILRAMPQVSGSWGTGRLLSSRLFSVLLTDDGRVFIGAVGPQQLYQAASSPATASLRTTK